MDVETDEEAVETDTYGPSTSNQLILLHVVDVYGVDLNERCFRVNEKIMSVVTYFIFFSRRSHAQKITSKYFMLSFYALILYFIAKFFKKSVQKSVFLR